MKYTLCFFRQANFQFQSLTLIHSSNDFKVEQPLFPARITSSKELQESQVAQLASPLSCLHYVCDPANVNAAERADSMVNINISQSHNTAE